MASASELAASFEASDGTTFGSRLGAFAVAAWDRAFDDVDGVDIVDPTVLPIMERLTRPCVLRDVHSSPRQLTSLPVERRS